MGQMDRRAFLRGAVATTGGVLVSGSLQTMLAGAVHAAPPGTTLAAVADLRDNKVRLNLPPGFSYRSFHDTDGPAVILGDGSTLTGRHDGMCAFPGPDGNVWLVRNHEQNFSAINGAIGKVNGTWALTPFDSSALGGTTTVLVTPFGEVLDSWVSCNGTQMNCAGGGMPWGAWITCEETINGPDVFDDFNRNIPTPSPPTTYIQNARLTKPHGFIFEVPADGTSTNTPIMHAGRFAHEAAAYSPNEGYVYLTEDNFGFSSHLYRYLPPSNPMEVGHLEDGGTLQALKVVGVHREHLEAAQVAGAAYSVEWVTIDNPFPPGPGGTFPMSGGTPNLPTTINDVAINWVGDQARTKGAARFSRLEGAKWTRNEIYFTSTQGGGASMGNVEQDDVAGYGKGTGQVWSYNPKTSVLTCRFQATGADQLDLPDNITAKSDRGTIVLCEDGPTLAPAVPLDQHTNYIRGLTREGELFDIALNRLRRNASPFAVRYNEEFAGATFGPGTDTLYVNIQASQAITFAIWGPWGRLGV